jgi:hypothetical protein
MFVASVRSASILPMGGADGATSASSRWYVADRWVGIAVIGGGALVTGLWLAALVYALIIALS